MNAGANFRSSVKNGSIPANPQITNLNGLLSDIYVRYVALKYDDFKLHYQVFDSIFQMIHKSMKEVDVYYNKYSSRVQFAGSHYDSLRINKPDEFDMDIIIDLPLSINNDRLNPNASDIILEPKGPGFVQLKMGVQFQKLPMRDEKEWLINKTAYQWKDDKNYLQSALFSSWFKGIVNKALNKHQVNASGQPTFTVDGVQYTIRRSEAGPAMTLFIENTSRGFRLDVDLVPALKFPEDRWPIPGGYQSIPPHCSAQQKVWMVVPKPNKQGLTPQDKDRTWRIAMHDQERGLMFDANNMKQAIRLIKQLRDAMNMKQIASYYIKTLFFWEVIAKNDRSFWSTSNPAAIFKLMVKRLHDALVAGSIPYFWNKKNNLIAGMDQGMRKGYAAKLSKLLSLLDSPADYKQVAKYLLTSAQFREYNAQILHISGI